MSLILKQGDRSRAERVDAARRIIRQPQCRWPALARDGFLGCRPWGEVLDTGLFDFDRAHEHPMWAKELLRGPRPRSRDRGIRRHQPCLPRPPTLRCPRRSLALLDGDLPGVIRAKGHFWIATRPDWVAEFSLAGALSSVTPLGTWWAAVPQGTAGRGHEAARDLHRAALDRAMGRPASGAGLHRGRGSTGPSLRGAARWPACWRTGPTDMTCPTRSPSGAGRRAAA